VQGIGLETIVAEVDELVDGFEWLKVEVDLLLGLAILHQDNSAIKDESIGRRVLVQLQLYTHWLALLI
jgi:hypothetical protein